MEKFVLRALANSAGVYVASVLVEGFTFSGDLFILAGIGIVLAAFHLFIYPILKILAFPLVIAGFGLFGFVTNIVVLWGIAYLLPQLEIEGIIPLISGTVILTIANLLVLLL